MYELFESSGLMLVLLNPFLVIVYLIDIVQKLNFSKFAKVMLRGSIISVFAFWSFALLGDAIFSKFVHAEFASFQIFGGVVFLLIGLQFVFKGQNAIEGLRGESAYIAGAIAMPIMIGPGTISASVIIGKRSDPIPACIAILIAVAVSAGIMLLLKKTHDYVRPRREQLIQRYFEIAGRITALFVGTISVEMIMRGLGAWIEKY
ncbi:MAG: MarC family protein [Chitinivibrionales bacterium]|nr:MarC family protein [Chitinivibrionales bacterium]